MKFDKIMIESAGQGFAATFEKDFRDDEDTVVLSKWVDEVEIAGAKLDPEVTEVVALERAVPGSSQKVHFSERGDDLRLHVEGPLGLGESL